MNDINIPPNALVVSKIDTSSWHEFSAEFHSAVPHNAVVLTGETVWKNGTKTLSMCKSCFMSVQSTDKNMAIATLRNELFRLLNDPTIQVFGYLAKPGLIPVESPTGLSWVAFCFPFLSAEGLQVSPEALRDKGYVFFAAEGLLGGQVGPPLPTNLKL